MVPFVEDVHSYSGDIPDGYFDSYYCCFGTLEWIFQGDFYMGCYDFACDMEQCQIDISVTCSEVGVWTGCSVVDACFEGYMGVLRYEFLVEAFSEVMFVLGLMDMGSYFDGGSLMASSGCLELVFFWLILLIICVPDIG